MRTEKELTIMLEINNLTIEQYNNKTPEQSKEIQKALEELKAYLKQVRRTEKIDILLK